MLAQRLNAEVFADVPHRQCVFTIPRRLRVYFLYDRSLLGKLCRAAYETLRQVVALELRDDGAVPAMVAAPQTFGDMMNFNPHVHSVVAEGVFLSTGDFVALPDAQMHRVAQFWQERVFALLLESHKIDEAVAGSMRTWPHSGFTAPVRGAAHRPVRLPIPSPGK